jgi:hypothetical protein
VWAGRHAGRADEADHLSLQRVLSVLAPKPNPVPVRKYCSIAQLRTALDSLAGNCGPSLPLLNTQRETDMNTPGQPTSYKPEHCVLARNYCLLGATNEELARFFEVSPRTIDNWIATHRAFAEAVANGKLFADAEVACRLYERAIGYVQTIERKEVCRGEEKVITTKVQHPPDTNACMFWLRNRQPDKWGRRLEDSSTSAEELLALLEAAGRRVREMARPDSASSAAATAA